MLKDELPLGEICKGVELGWGGIVTNEDILSSFEQTNFNQQLL